MDTRKSAKPSGKGPGGDAQNGAVVPHAGDGATSPGRGAADGLSDDEPTWVAGGLGEPVEDEPFLPG